MVESFEDSVPERREAFNAVEFISTALPEGQRRDTVSPEKKLKGAFGLSAGVASAFHCTFELAGSPEGEVVPADSFGGTPNVLTNGETRKGSG